MKWPCLLLLIGLLHTGQPTAVLSARINGQPPKLRVVIFLDTECPISQKVAPRIQALADTYKETVSFDAIFPSQYVTSRDVNQFKQGFSLRVSSQIDKTHRFVNRYHATTTPEVLLLSDTGRILYRGQIDNQFYQLGKYRAKPTEFYLRDAIEAVLNGRPVVVEHTTPTGCLIGHLDSVH